MMLNTGQYCEADCTDLELATVLLDQLEQIDPDTREDARHKHYTAVALVGSDFEPIDRVEKGLLGYLVEYLVEQAIRYVPDGYYMGFRNNDWHQPFGVWEENKC